MESKIDLKDVISVQNEILKVNVIRINTEEKNPYNEDWPFMSIKIIPIKIDYSKYKILDSDIIEEVINTILNNSINIKRKDLPLVNEVITNSTNIAFITRRGCGNYAIFSYDAIDKFKQSCKDIGHEKVFNEENNMINESIKAYVSPYLKSGIIVGYQGNMVIDGGIVLNIIDTSDTIKKYKIEIPINSNNYYRYIET